MLYQLSYTPKRFLPVTLPRPADHAGLKPHDIIVVLNGRKLAAPAQGRAILDEIWLQSSPGETVTLVVQRPQVPQALTITPVFRHMGGGGDTVSLAKKGAIEVVNLYPLLFLVVGLAVLFLRIEDRNAWILALLFAGFISESELPLGFHIAAEGLRQFLFAYKALAKSLLPGLFYFFFAVFPTRSLIDRKLPWLKWVLRTTSCQLVTGE